MKVEEEKITFIMFFVESFKEHNFHYLSVIRFYQKTNRKVRVEM